MFCVYKKVVSSSGVKYGILDTSDNSVELYSILELAKIVNEYKINIFGVHISSDRKVKVSLVNPNILTNKISMLDTITKKFKRGDDITNYINLISSYSKVLSSNSFNEAYYLESLIVDNDNYCLYFTHGYNKDCCSLYCLTKDGEFIINKQLRGFGYFIVEPSKHKNIFITIKTGLNSYISFDYAGNQV